MLCKLRRFLILPVFESFFLPLYIYLFIVNFERERYTK